MEIVRDQISAGARDRERCRRPDEVRQAFLCHASPASEHGGERLLPASQVRSALQQLGVVLDEKEVRNYLIGAGLDMDSLGLDEFRRAAEGPWSGEVWAQSLPLAQLLSDALPACSGCHRLRAISSLTAEEIRAVAEGFSEALQRLLAERVEQLRDALAATDGHTEGPGPHRKFEVVPMSCGRIEDFHGGLAKRVGEPRRRMALLAAGAAFRFIGCLSGTRIVGLMSKFGAAILTRVVGGSGVGESMIVG